MARLVASREPGAVERWDASSRLERIVVTEMFCRELSDAAPDYLGSRCGAAYRIFHMWLADQAEQPDGSADLQTLRGDPWLDQILPRLAAAEQVLKANQFMDGRSSEFQALRALPMMCDVSASGRGCVLPGPEEWQEGAPNLSFRRSCIWGRRCRASGWLCQGSRSVPLGRTLR